MPIEQRILRIALHAIVFSVLFGVVPVDVIYSQDLTLPIYDITIDSVHIDSLENDIWSSVTYPAKLKYENEEYECQVRYRGNSGRISPKRSWKVFFANTGPLGREQTNLNSEYRDRSISRNHLGLEISRRCGLLTPESRFISLIINGIYSGVYHEVEQVDRNFLKRRNLPDREIFKILNHCGRFAPSLRSEDILKIYELSNFCHGAYDRLGKRLSFVQNSDSGSFEEWIDEYFDPTDVLTYFAVQYFIRNEDGITKNFFLYHEEGGQYVFIPWDIDCSFGNNAWGDFIAPSDTKCLFPMHFQGLFQRLIRNPERLNEFLGIIDDLASEKFDMVTQLVDETYDQIQHDAHIDTFKRSSNVIFDQERHQIISFLEQRREVLSNIDWFKRIDIDQWTISNEYISEVSDIIRVEATAGEKVANAYVYFLDNSQEYVAFKLWDDGSHGDVIAGDLNYSSECSLEEYNSPFHYGFLVKPNPFLFCPTPPAGGWLFSNIPLSLPMIRIDENPPQANEIEIRSFHYDSTTDSHYLTLVNSVDREVNLSGCVVRIGHDFRMLRLGEIPALKPNDTLFVTNHCELVSGMLPEKTVTGNLYFKPSVSDTVYLETSSGRVLSSKIVSIIEEYFEPVGQIVINEINYNSSNDFNPRDWIEIYCRIDSLNLNNWTVSDSRAEHSFQFPNQTLSAGEYLVIARDLVTFSNHFPNVKNVIGGFDFGFSGRGDDVKLYDSCGVLVDVVSYDDKNPWPEEADGEGYTLELISPLLPNNNQMNWLASSILYGTPGKVNSVCKEDNPGNEDVTNFISIFPNPFNYITYLTYEIQEAGLVSLKVYDLNGRYVDTLFEGKQPIGRHIQIWNAVALPSGFYIVRLTINTIVKASKALLIK